MCRYHDKSTNDPIAWARERPDLHVYINGKTAVVVCIDHPDGPGLEDWPPLPVYEPDLHMGSKRVFIGGLEVVRVGDPNTGRGYMAEGSPNVFAGGSPNVSHKLMAQHAFNYKSIDSTGTLIEVEGTTGTYTTNHQFSPLFYETQRVYGITNYELLNEFPYAQNPEPLVFPRLSKWVTVSTDPNTGLPYMVYSRLYPLVRGLYPDYCPTIPAYEGGDFDWPYDPLTGESMTATPTYPAPPDGGTLTADSEYSSQGINASEFWAPVG